MSDIFVHIVRAKSVNNYLLLRFDIVTTFICKYRSVKMLFFTINSNEVSANYIVQISKV